MNSTAKKRKAVKPLTALPETGKKITVRESEIKSDDAGNMLNTLDLIKITINTPVSDLMDLAEIAGRIAILNKLDGMKKEDIIQLTEKEAAILAKAYAGMKWGLTSSIFLDLANDLGVEF